MSAFVEKHKRSLFHGVQNHKSISHDSAAFYHVLTCTLATTCSVLSTMRLLTKWPSLVYIFEVSVKRPRDKYIETIRLFAFDLYAWQLTRNRNVDLKRRLLGLIHGPNIDGFFFCNGSRHIIFGIRNIKRPFISWSVNDFVKPWLQFKMELYLKRLALSGMQFNMI